MDLCRSQTADMSALTHQGGRQITFHTALLATPRLWPTCQALSRAHGFSKHHIAAPIPTQTWPTPCSILGAPDGLILVALFRTFTDSIVAGRRH